MTIVVMSDTPGMSADQYDSVAVELGLRARLPEGCLTYIAGPTPDENGWREVSVWKAAAQAKEFMDTRLRPTMERFGAKPIWGPPITWDLHELIGG